MSIQSESAVDDDEQPEEQHRNQQQLSYHPSAPSDELFDISTTVDPSYVISLIRKLLPSNIHSSSNISSHRADVCDDSSVQGSDGEGTGQNVAFLSSDNTMVNSSNGGYEAMDTVSNFSEINGQDEGIAKSHEHENELVKEEAWEESGCILWDLASSTTHAELMVQNFALEVLLASLMVGQSARVTEIALGIIGNLACHEISRKQIASTKGLVEAIVDQLFVDDTPCLCEAFRLLTLCLQGTEALTWAEALQHENVLSRILWVVENTLNTQLIERSVGLLLAVLESQQEVIAVLLPSLVKLGLPTLLINLFAFEMTKLTGEREPERYSVLEVILRTIEALSVIDGYSQELCSSKILFQLLKDLVKLPDKIEFANSCVTAAVLTANILTDAADLAVELSTDLLYLQGLFDIYPFALDDLEAQSALWSVFSSLLVLIEENKMSPSNLRQYVSILVSKSDLLEEELINHQFDACVPKLVARTTALKRIYAILRQWTVLKDQNKESAFMVEDHFNDEVDVDKLLDYYRKYIKDST